MTEKAREGPSMPDVHVCREVRLSYGPRRKCEAIKDSRSSAELARRIVDPRADREHFAGIYLLAIDKTRLQDLDEAIRKFLAWDSILDEKEQLDLSPHQVKQAQTQRTAADAVVTARLPEAYQWLLVPTQAKPEKPVEWQSMRLNGQDALAVRASKKLRNDGLLATGFASSSLRLELDRVPLWRSAHVPISQLVEDFARYVYLQRLKDSSVLIGAVRDGLALITWEHDAFAYAESFDEATGRYRGLRVLQNVAVANGDTGILVKPEVARKQLDAEKPKDTPAPAPGGAPNGSSPADGPEAGGSSPTVTHAKVVRRFHGTASLDSARVGRDAGRIADEVVSHLAGLVGSKVRVTIEIEAEFEGGVSDQVVRTVTENSRTLKFTSHGFETD